jgi:Uma2 family endonuclease
MGAAKAVRPLSLEEYLALEREAPVKHELLEGFPHAMAGASDRHNRVVVNLVLVLAPWPGKRAGWRCEASPARASPCPSRGRRGPPGESRAGLTCGGLGDRLGATLGRLGESGP